MMSTNVVDNYGWSSVSSPPSCGYITPRALALLKQYKAKRVLDLGSGNGLLCGTLKQAGYDVVGVDYDKHGVELARASFPEIPFYNFGVQDDPKELLAHQEPFDIVLSTEVIEHLFSPHLLPIYAKRVLRPGGHLIVTTPYHGYLKNLAVTLCNHWDAHHSPLWHGGHVKFWSRATLTQLFNQNGFDVVGFSGVGRCPYLWCSMFLIGKST